MQSLKGHLLVATPQLVGPAFSRTVLLMLEHSDEGAAGVILNRATDATVTDVSERIFDEPFTWEKPLNLGGPVSGPLMLVHLVEELADREIFPGLYNTVDSDKLRRLIRTRPEPALVIANYAGWGPGQLESEFEEDSWVSMPATQELVFWNDEADLWEVATKSIRTAHLTRLLGLKGVPDDPSAN